MIKGPRHAGNYSLRDHDCKAALQEPVSIMLGGCHSPFVDFASLLHAILPTAKAAGWEDEEIRAALIEVTNDYRIRPR